MKVAIIKGAGKVTRQSLLSDAGGYGCYHRAGWGGDRRSLVTLTHYKAANIENEYSGTELAV